MAGVPFDELGALATPRTAEAARDLIATEALFSQAKKAVEALLASRKHDLSKERPDEFERLKAKYDAWNANNIPQLWHDSREGKKGGKGQEDAD